MGEKKKSKKKNWDIVGFIGHNCLFATIVILIWKNLEPLVSINTTAGRIFGGLILLVSGIGGLALYIPIGIRLEEIRMKYGDKKYRRSKSRT